jgi:carboxyl-terminal processing protease
MKINKLIFYTLLLILISSSCKKDPVLPSDVAVTPAMGRDSLYYIMKEWYYWFDKMPTVTKEDYADPYLLMEAMRYKALDRWSFVSDFDEFNAQMQGTFVGHGFRVGVDATGNARIAMIYNKSPLYAEGVRRGWIIKKVNNQDLAPILISGDGAAYSALIGPSTAGITNVFLFQKPDGSTTTISSTKSTFTVNTVILSETITLKNGPTGHLVFEQFITPSSDELATAFAQFKANNVTDLILDLRYNSGGYLSIAQSLASYIAGDSKAGAVFAKLSYNSKHQATNSIYAFKTTTSSLSLPRIVVITSRSTASASEAVMNGLKPYVNVISIGDSTNGKPTGMNGWEIGKKYYMWPVTFKMVNAQNEGDYFKGIGPAKLAPDDITHDFSDQNEACLKEAIYYLNNGAVSAKGSSDFKRSQQFSDNPKWMKIPFALDK